MKAFGKWMAGGVLLGVLAALLVFAPASWLASNLESASGGQALLQAPRGTVWSGSADLVLTGGAGSKGQIALPTRLYWQISPAWLGLDVALHSACCAPVASPVQLGLRASGFSFPPSVAWRVATQNLLLPAELLAGLGAPWNTMQLAGTLKLSAQELAGKWSERSGLEDITGRAALDVLDVTTALSTIKPLGSYRLSSTGAVMRLETLSDQPSEAALLLSGTGKIEQGRMSFLGEASAAAGSEEALSNLLHIVGQWQPSVDGRARSILKL